MPCNSRIESRCAVSMVQSSEAPPQIIETAGEVYPGQCAVRRVGKGALAPCPPSRAVPCDGGHGAKDRAFAHPTTELRPCEIYFSSAAVEVAGPSPMISSTASSSLAPSQCTCLPKCVTKVAAGI